MVPYHSSLVLITLQHFLLSAVEVFKLEDSEGVDTVMMTLYLI